MGLCVCLGETGSQAPVALAGRAVSIPDRNQGSNWMLVKTGHKTGQKAEKERLQRHMPVSPQQSGAGGRGRRGDR